MEQVLRRRSLRQRRLKQSIITFSRKSTFFKFSFQLLGSGIFCQRIRHLEVVEEPLLLDGVHRVAVDGGGDGEAGASDDPVLPAVLLVSLGSFGILPLGHSDELHLEVGGAVVHQFIGLICSIKISAHSLTPFTPIFLKFLARKCD